MPGDSALLNVRETARRLGVHENTIRSWARQGLLPDARVPGTNFFKFRERDVEQLIDQRGKRKPSLAEERRIVGGDLVTASQLELWPEQNSREAQERFPELVRRLLFETPGASQISVRAGDGVAQAGYDGTAVLAEPTHLLPAGRLVFEFGTSMDKKRKASSDFDARRTNASQDETFVFVTVRRWPGKDVWAAERRAEKVFRDVLALDADDLETWLQVAPAAHIWVSELLGLSPSDAEMLDHWWLRFSAATRPILPASLFLAGRIPQAEGLRRALLGNPDVITIRSEWAEDALAFAFATLEPGPEATATSKAPVTIVESQHVWNRMVARSGNGILVPRFDGPDVTAATNAGKHVIVLADVVSGQGGIRLPRVGRSEAAEAFRECGLEWRQADRLAVLARRSMPAAVRQLARAESTHSPAWSKPPLASTLAGLMLANQWTDIDEDQAMLEQLTDRTVGEIRSVTDEVSSGADPAIRRVQTGLSGVEVSTFASMDEAFIMLRRYISQDLGRRWSAVAARVLLAADPSQEVTRENRIALREGQLRSPSSGLRKGFAVGLAAAGAIEPDPEGFDHALAPVIHEAA